MIGEVGALGAGLVPNAIGLSKQYAGSHMWGSMLFAGLAIVILVMLHVMQIRGARTWVEKGKVAGRAVHEAPTHKQLYAKPACGAASTFASSY